MHCVQAYKMNVTFPVNCGPKRAVMHLVNVTC